MAHNGMLATVYFRLQQEEAELNDLLETLPGGREAVMAEAAERRAELEKQEADADQGTTPAGTPIPGTPAGIPMTPTGSTHYTDPSEAFRRHLINMTESNGHSTGPHKKKSTLATDALPQPQADLPVGTSLEPSHTTTPRETRPPGTLAWSTNERVALLARNMDAMQDELRSNGAKGLVWPQNVTYRHFFEYFTFPTLVYQLEYPRTNT